MKARYESRDKAVRSSLQGDWNQYKSLRNRFNKNVKNDRKDNLRKHFDKLHEDKNVKGLYDLTKKKLGWNKAGDPEMFVINGEGISNPKEMTDIQMNTFSNKVKNFIEKLPPQVNDPLAYLKQALQRWET